ncbi:MAG: type II toxin-antitoxin system VapC family toxin [Nitrospinae bacterium]|nr:type II toxin-antitoxin system VapC family toxin [Nitrospinota bacterium]
MPYFIDTSALFKRYQPEQGTDLVCQILEDTNEPVFISSLSIIEVVSNLKRLSEIDKITTEEQFYLQRSFFYRDINTLGIRVLDITPTDIIKAEGFILKRYMKPIDSIQLAVALNIPLAGMTFVSSDQRFCNIAKAEELLILNPEKPIL